MELNIMYSGKRPTPAVNHTADPAIEKLTPHIGPQPPILPQYLLDRSKWTVMGKRLFCRIRKASVVFPGPSTAIYLLVFALLVTSVLSDSRCSFTKCVKTYERADRRIRRMDDSTPTKFAEQTRQRCRALRKYRRCIDKNHLPCRGNLFFHSVEHINSRQLEEYSCTNSKTKNAPRTTATPRTQPPPRNTTTTPPKRHFPEDEAAVEGDTCTYTGKSTFRHCGMFGDPHLRTFHDEFFTCNVVKAWPLIDNDYLVVMATNIPVTNGSAVTATTKITVLIKASSPCTEQKFYLANNSKLSPSFTDGTISSGSVSVDEVIPGRHVEIQVRFIGTTIIIRKVGSYLTFAIRMPHEFIEGLDPSRQLCVQGCPSRHRIDLKASNKGHGNTLLPGTKGSTRNTAIPPVPKAEQKKIFTEEEARQKCKQIMLAETNPIDETGNKDGQTDSDEVNQLSHAQSSAAFSSLVPSEDQGHHQINGKQVPTVQQLRTSLDGTVSEPKRRKKPGSRNRRPGRGKHHHRNRNRKHRKSKRGVSDVPPCPEEQDVGISNFYFDSCVFDLLTTGDVNFTLSARAALEDVRRTHTLRDSAPGASLVVIRTWEPLEPTARSRGCTTEAPVVEENPTSSSRRSQANSFVILLCAVLTCVFINGWSSCNDAVKKTHTNVRCVTKGQMSPFLNHEVFFRTTPLNCMKS
ncbi:repulsive guidance molecule A isoform X1 [Ciona intestinalis]